MRFSKTMLFAAFFALVASTSFATETVSNDAKDIRYEIIKLLSKMDLEGYDFTESKVNVSFMVNEKNEIIVTSTDNKELDNVIKYRLNYKKVKAQDVKVLTQYTIPVVLKNS